MDNKDEGKKQRCKEEEKTFLKLQSGTEVALVHLESFPPLLETGDVPPNKEFRISATLNVKSKFIISQFLKSFESKTPELFYIGNTF